MKERPALDASLYCLRQEIEREVEREVSALAAEVKTLREVARKVHAFLKAGVEDMHEGWVPGPVSNQYGALVDAWLALPSELRDALGKQGEEGE